MLALPTERELRSHWQHACALLLAVLRARQPVLPAGLPLAAPSCNRPPGFAPAPAADHPLTPAPPATRLSDRNGATSTAGVPLRCRLRRPAGDQVPGGRLRRKRGP